MAQVILTDEGLGKLCDLLFKKQTADSFADAKVGLMTAPTAPTRATNLAGITEATFAGYGRITLAGATWPASSVAANIAASEYGAVLTWTRSTTGTAQVIYGVFIINNAATILLGVGLLDGGPYTVTNAGDAISEVLTLGFASLYV